MLQCPLVAEDSLVYKLTGILQETIYIFQELCAKKKVTTDVLEILRSRTKYAKKQCGNGHVPLSNCMFGCKAHIDFLSSETSLSVFPWNIQTLFKTCYSISFT